MCGKLDKFSHSSEVKERGYWLKMEDADYFSQNGHIFFQKIWKNRKCVCKIGQNYLVHIKWKNRLLLENGREPNYFIWRLIFTRKRAKWVIFLPESVQNSQICVQNCVNFFYSYEVKNRLNKNGCNIFFSKWS